MEEIKDLGGLVNKDLAFSKLPQGAVFDSENFRITTEDGNTMAARQNIKGTVSLTTLTASPCIRNITFDPTLTQTLLIPGMDYELQIILDSTILPSFIFNYSNLTTLTADLTVFLTNEFNTNYAGENIVVTNSASNIITFVMPNCNTIIINSLVQFPVRGTITSYPYELFDPDFSIVNYAGNNYNTNPYQVPQWYTYDQNINANLTVTNEMVQGVQNQAGATITNTASVIKYKVVSSGPDTDVAFLGEPKYLNNILTTSPSLFDYFLGGPYLMDFSFYVAKTSDTVVDIDVLFDLGPNINTVFTTANGIPTVTIPNYGYPLLKLTSTITVPAGITDYDKLIGSGGAVSFNYNITGLGAAYLKDVLTPGSSYQFNGIVIRVRADDNIVAPPYNFTLYLDNFRLRGPVINLNAIVNVNTVANSVSAGNIIGWTSLRDNIYLFTTDGMFDPDDPTTGPFTSTGQIWKFSYDKAGDYADPANYSLNLVYSNQLNFTTSRPIANPGMIESRYENPDIQKIYWTDNYNVPRQINVADPNVANLTVEDLNLQPSLTMDLPVVTQVIDGGDLLVGVYQVAYRLKNTNGSETRFSRTSQLIPIIDAQETNATVTTYYPVAGVRSNANKAIRVQVDNVDTTYDTIEFALIYYFDDTSVPEIYIAAEEFIPASGFVTTIISGSGDLIPITVDELTAFTTFIKRAKTLAAKKQTLFLGNLTIADQIVDFDARTYRFARNSTQTSIYNTLANPADVVSYDPITGAFTFNFTANPVPAEHGSFQTYDDQAPDLDTRFLYQPGTNILGGKGPNITYEFFTENVKLDNKFDSILTGATGSGGPHMTPDTNAVISFNSIDRSYVAQGTSLSNNGSPYTYDIYVGYRRDEMYRFGIVFFDELDNPTYVNWIGDIRMPHIFMPSTTNGASGAGGTRNRIGVGLNTTFSSDTTYWNFATNDLYGKPLGVKFTIDFSSVATKYKKAAIVRTPLTDNDRHVVAQGLLQPTFKSDGVAGPTYTDANTVFTCNAARGNYAYNTFNDLWYDCWTLHSPEFTFKDYPGFTSNDSIDVLGLMFKTDVSYLMGNTSLANRVILDSALAGGSPDQRWSAFRVKNYQLVESATQPASIKGTNTYNPYPLTSARPLDVAGTNGRLFDTGFSTLTTNGGYSTARRVFNCAPKDLNTSGLGLSYPDNPGYSYGSKALFVQMQSNQALNWNNPAGGGNGDYMFVDGWTALPIPSQFFFHNHLANYKKTILDPFGGQDYFSRASSEYIPCNNLIDITDRTTPIKQTKVFGGDTKVAVMDKAVQYFDRAEAVTFSSRVDIFFKEVFIPVETSVGIDYRRTYNNVPAVDSSTEVPNKTPYLTIIDNAGSVQWDSRNCLENLEHFEVDPVFNHTDKSVYRYFPKPALGNIPTVYDCRVWRSEKKIDGELTESWSIFKPSSFLDVESAYGPLNNLVVFQDKLYFIQDRGFGVLQVAEQKLINDQAGNADLVLGSSGILERYDYVSTQTGTKHQFSMSVSDYSLIWFDTLARKLYRYKPGALEPLTDVKGYSAFIYNNTDNGLQVTDNPYRMDSDPNNPFVWTGVGIHSTYDYRYDEFYMTFLNPDKGFSTTIVYNDLFDGFVGRYTFAPKVFINDKINIFAPYLNPQATLDTIYIHNYGDYGRFYNNQLTNPSIVSFVVNSNPTVEKTFTNLEVVAEAYKKNTIAPGVDPHQYDSLAEIDYYNFFEEMRVFDNYQNTDWQPLNVLSRRHKTIWNIKIPSDRVLDVTTNIFDGANLDPLRPRLTRRMKDKWFVVDLKYDNSSNNSFVVHSAKALYSVNSR